VLFTVAALALFQIVYKSVALLKVQGKWDKLTELIIEDERFTLPS
jgi:hypothetical protein